jgi:hypothetical protein
MAQVSIGQVENLEDLVRGLQSVREALETACREQIAVAQQKCAEAREEAQNSAEHVGELHSARASGTAKSRRC